MQARGAESFLHQSATGDGESFLASMKSVSDLQCIKKALDCLRQRYGVSGGLITESKIIEIRHRAKITFNVGSLKHFNEELNILEVFAYAHDKFEKLSDVASRLFGVLQRHYLDYFAQIGVIPLRLLT